jgi:hypothetical protein
MPAILQVAAPSPRGSSCPYTVPVIARDVHKRPADSFGRHSASPPVPARPTRPSVGRRESGGKSCRRLALSSVPTWSAGCTAVPMSVLPLQARAIRTTDTRRGPTGTARRFVLGLVMASVSRRMQRPPPQACRPVPRTTRPGHQPCWSSWWGGCRWSCEPSRGSWAGRQQPG